MPITSLVEDGTRAPWGTLRYWLGDLASELWDATRTLPTELSVDHVWITSEERAILLDESFSGVETPVESIPVEDVAGQQCFLNAIAAGVESTSLPVPARGVLQNLADGKLEKLSFLTGTLRGLLDRPAEVIHPNRGLHDRLAGAWVVRR